MDFYRLVLGMLMLVISCNMVVIQVYSNPQIRLFTQMSQKSLIAVQTVHGMSSSGHMFTASNTISLPQQRPECQQFVSSEANVSSSKVSKGDFVVASPNYPGLYHNDIDCVRVLQAPEESDTISLEWITLQLEYDSSCSSDFLEIRDGPFGYSRLLGRVCEHYKHRNKIIQSTGRYLWLWFHSDATLSNRGFLAIGTVMKGQNPLTNSPPSSSVCHMSIHLHGSEITLNRSQVMDLLDRTLTPSNGLTKRSVFNSSNHQDPFDCSFDVVAKYPLQIYLDFASLRFPSKNEQCDKTSMEWYDGITFAHKKHTVCSRRHSHPFIASAGRSVLRLMSQHQADLMNFTLIFNTMEQGPCSLSTFDCGDDYCIDRNLLCNNNRNCPNGTDEYCREGKYVGSSESMIVVSFGPLSTSSPKVKFEIDIHYIILLIILIAFIFLTTFCCIISVRRKQKHAKRQQNELCNDGTSPMRFGSSVHPQGSLDDDEMDVVSADHRQWNSKTNSLTITSMASPWKNREYGGYSNVTTPNLKSNGNLPLDARHRLLRDSSTSLASSVLYPVRINSNNPSYTAARRAQNRNKFPRQQSMPSTSSNNMSSTTSRESEEPNQVSANLQKRIGRYLAVQNPIIPCPDPQTNNSTPLKQMNHWTPVFSPNSLNHTNHTNLTNNPYSFHSNRTRIAPFKDMNSFDCPDSGTMDSLLSNSTSHNVEPCSRLSRPMIATTAFTQMSNGPSHVPSNLSKRVEMKRVKSCGPDTFYHLEADQPIYEEHISTPKLSQRSLPPNRQPPLSWQNRVINKPNLARSLPNFQEETNSRLEIGKGNILKQSVASPVMKSKNIFTSPNYPLSSPMGYVRNPTDSHPHMISRYSKPVIVSSPRGRIIIQEFDA